MHFWNTERIDWCRLRECFPPADIYLCGSDQIWNPYTKDGRNDPGYFLDYVPHDKKRIAYAPSFGCDDIPPSARADLKYYIDQFASVSVREREGADIVRRYAGKTVPVLADPTFLLTPEQWCDIARIPPGTPDKYILCYRFMRNGTMTECIDDLSRCLSLPVITLPLSTLSLRDRYIKQFEAGPEDFIGLIRGAALVCTDSFHATAFSMLMNTPFYTFLDLDAGNYGTNMNSRIRNAIGLAGLESRVIRTKGEIDLSAVFDVDFSECNKSLDAFRAVSLEWLTGALAGGAGMNVTSQADFDARCTGCEACANSCPASAIRMRADEDGFLYPAVDGGKCTGCGACTGVCPLTSDPVRAEPACRYGYARDAGLRRSSSSGGIFSLLAESVIEQGGVVLRGGIGGKCGRAYGHIVDRRARRAQGVEIYPKPYRRYVSAGGERSERGKAGAVQRHALSDCRAEALSQARLRAAADRGFRLSRGYRRPCSMPKCSKRIGRPPRPSAKNHSGGTRLFSGCTEATG